MINNFSRVLEEALVVELISLDYRFMCGGADGLTELFWLLLADLPSAWPSIGM